MAVVVIFRWAMFFLIVILALKYLLLPAVGVEAKWPWEKKKKDHLRVVGKDKQSLDNFIEETKQKLAKYEQDLEKGIVEGEEAIKSRKKEIDDMKEALEQAKKASEKFSN
jgi:hypothetical protein